MSTEHDNLERRYAMIYYKVLESRRKIAGQNLSSEAAAFELQAQMINAVEFSRGARPHCEPEG